MSKLRTLKRKQEREHLSDTDLRRPTGKIVGPPMSGEFLTIPLTGWASLRAKTRTPLVMLQLLLINSLDDPTPRTTLQVELPVYEDTKLKVVGFLQRFGWDGRVWPKEPGWPSGSEVDEANLRAILEASGLSHTLVFPSTDLGAIVYPVSFTKSEGPFLMEPLPEVTEVDPDLISKLDAVLKTPELFFEQLLN